MTQVQGSPNPTLSSVGSGFVFGSKPKLFAAGQKWTRSYLPQDLLLGTKLFVPSVFLFDACAENG